MDFGGQEARGIDFSLDGEFIRTRVGDTTAHIHSWEGDVHKGDVVSFCIIIQPLRRSEYALVTFIHLIKMLCTAG